MTSTFKDLDLTLETPSGFFNCRAAYLIFEDGKILLQQSPQGYWFVPGGRISFGEASSYTVLREVEEELGLLPEAIDFAGVCENFFSQRRPRFSRNHVFLPDAFFT